MRVALFFDGKNHMKDLRRTTQDTWLDHGALADWIVKHVGGTRFAGAWYYTGVPTGQDEGHERHALSDLLDEIEKRPGFFVRRFNRRVTARECPHCGQTITYTEEKMVDTSLVVDAVRMAENDAFDVAVFFSGDLDVCPALSALRELGKQAWIATFGDLGLSRTLLREAWSYIDLTQHLTEFAYPELTPSPRVSIPPPPPPGPVDAEHEMLRELGRAESHFGAGGGFVGAHYFLHRWKGHAIPDAPEARRQILQRLLTGGLVETYAVDGKTALRTATGGSASADTPVPLPPAGSAGEMTPIED
jgi:uncharacterized LabA/DUF88 family protein